MAQKRMFDRAIIDTDRFMDLPVSAKALYFLLGMEADDEGFVSYKKVIRIHGGTDDDIKVLMAKDFVIGFPSGVVVITDWQKNNYLNTNRIKETEYLFEKSQLKTKNGKYLIDTGVKPMLNNGLTSIEENRVEESSIVESSIGKKTKTLEEQLEPFKKKYCQRTITDFTLYWKETNSKGKERWQLEKTWNIDLRLIKWERNQATWQKEREDRLRFKNTTDEELMTKSRFPEKVNRSSKIDEGFTPINFDKYKSIVK